LRAGFSMGFIVLTIAIATEEVVGR
jgi:hypothetical protein